MTPNNYFEEYIKRETGDLWDFEHIPYRITPSKVFKIRFEGWQEGMTLAVTPDRMIDMMETCAYVFHRLKNKYQEDFCFVKPEMWITQNEFGVNIIAFEKKKLSQETPTEKT